MRVLFKLLNEYCFIITTYECSTIIIGDLIVEGLSRDQKCSQLGYLNSKGQESSRVLSIAHTIPMIDSKNVEVLSAQITSIETQQKLLKMVSCRLRKYLMNNRCSEASF